jgi:hypothetical protein
MTRVGYTLMTEQNGSRELVRYAQGAERAGFDPVVESDRCFPRLTVMGHAPTPGRCSVRWVVRPPTQLGEVLGGQARGHCASVA